MEIPWRALCAQTAAIIRLQVQALHPAPMGEPGTGDTRREGTGIAKEWAKPFYNSEAWKIARTQTLLESGYTCEVCGGHAEEVHHEIELTPENISDPAISLNPRLLHPLCGDCHKRITKRQKHKRRPDCEDDFYFDADGNLTPRGE